MHDEEKADDLENIYPSKGLIKRSSKRCLDWEGCKLSLTKGNATLFDLNMQFGLFMQLR